MRKKTVWVTQGGASKQTPPTEGDHVHRVTTRVYAEDSDGRKILLYSPGMVISDEDAKRAGLLDARPEPKRLTDRWTAMERREEPTEPPPAKSLDRMKLDELRAVCAAEDIDPADANMRADYIKVICAARGQRRSNPNER